MRDHYEVLQVNPRADAEVIRAAYRVLARKYHPDHGGDPAAMIALNDAWDVLGDQSRRAAYDEARLAEKRSAASHSGAGTGWPSAAGGGQPAAAGRGPWAAGTGRQDATVGAQPSYQTGSPAGSSFSGPTASDAGFGHAGPPPGNPSGATLDFGRYSGWSLGEIARVDLDYLEWLQRATVGRHLRTEIDLLLRQWRPGRYVPRGSARR